MGGGSGVVHGSGVRGGLRQRRLDSRREGERLLLLVVLVVLARGRRRPGGNAGGVGKGNGHGRPLWATTTSRHP